MRVSFSTKALAEAGAAASWYLEHGGDSTSRDFTREVQRVTRLINRYPDLGTPGILDTRHLGFKRFPYSLVYRVQGDVIYILAVAHQRRRPGYWRRPSRAQGGDS